MKKMLMFVFAVFAFITCTAHAEEAILPACEVRLNGTPVESEYREYPLLQYRDITYFPMTYYDCRFLGLTTEWDSYTESLSIRKENISGMYRDYRSETRNSGSWYVMPREIPFGEEIELPDEYAAPCGFVITVNGKQIDNYDEAYPLLTFRGVTYFPLTWRFAHDEFGWSYSYTEKDGLVIDSDNYHTEILDLPGFTGVSVATDGEYYYYQGGQDIYRTPVNDTADCELIYTMPLPPTYYNAPRNGSTASPASFSYEYGVVRMFFTDIDSVTFTQNYYMKYDPESNTFVTDDKPDVTKLSVGPSPQHYYYNGIKVTYSPYGISYQKDGETVKLDWIKNYSLVRFADHKIYVKGQVDGFENEIISCIDMETDKLTEYLLAPENFYPFSGPKGDSLLLRQDGGLYIYDTISEEITMVDEKTDPICEAVFDGTDILAAFKSDEGIALASYGNYGMGTKTELFYTDTLARAYEIDGAMAVELYYEKPQDKYRLVVSNGTAAPFMTADFLHGDSVYYGGSVYKYKNTVIYVLDGKAVKVELGGK